MSSVFADRAQGLNRPLLWLDFERYAARVFAGQPADWLTNAHRHADTLSQAQRLVRRLCTHCRAPYDAPPELVRQLPEAAAALADASGTLRLWRAVGCSYCGGSGYSGRAAIFEIISIDEDMRRLIKPDVSAEVIAQAARRAGMSGMMADGLRKCREGVTTVEELGRVASED